MKGEPMSRLRVTAILALSAVVLAGCATTMGAGAYAQRGLELSRYRTYDWGPADALPTGDPRLDKDPDFRDHLEGAVEKQLAAKGFVRATQETGRPDLLLHYHASIDTRIDVGQTEREYGACRNGDCQSWVVNYEAGTLVLDMVDAKSERLIWRGWAQDSVAPMLADRNRMRQKIQEAVGRMMGRFPHR